MSFTFLYCFIVKQQLSFKKTFLNLKLRGVTGNTKKEKTPDAIKQELLLSVIEIADNE